PRAKAAVNEAQDSLLVFQPSEDLCLIKPQSTERRVKCRLTLEFPAYRFEACLGCGPQFRVVPLLRLRFTQEQALLDKLVQNAPGSFRVGGSVRVPALQEKFKLICCSNIAFRDGLAAQGCDHAINNFAPGTRFPPQVHDQAQAGERG